MRLLMLGGTGFVGGATVAEAVHRGWSVTVFNRGRHGAPPAGVRRLVGDRTTPGGLAALADGEWDLVVDTWDGAPQAARTAAQALSARVGHYVYVSSGSVYAPPVATGVTEQAPLVDADPDALDGDYPTLKAGAEKALRAVFGDRVLLARAGLILGPGEDIGRLPWWLHRITRGGDVLVPGPADLPVQYVDVRDLAVFLLDAATAGLGGPVNVVSRPGHTTMGELLTACVTATGAAARLHWVDPERLLAAGVEPWNDLPVWIPAGHEYRWMQQIDVGRAHTAGLTCRPVADTVADTWAWLRQVGGVPARAGRPAREPIGLDPARETELLGALGEPATSA
ncbi:Nucleoside-diphosphate-sugar epimerase [Micromonospora phaseoli]|uniref:Nucleoside-diphosphate-sugar epimerase n=1 Tax=Micromonospora phaseoli TaxID=1144548 RepID=A0A1H6RZ44_9ACTN|nr:NAD-dependent epimerase/dehydratase family protein [Micromonospora phaseoli]PZW03730.1 nucleoside-diphosphate-sugar epimerase [Micromonospora phaseoli]GIJ81325.1 reductase [Micromonospora phaseoli]SEI60961.1 Nucleoside-diphosphate-sugar epimerase [Micromonospora phaseoli]